MSGKLRCRIAQVLLYIFALCLLDGGRHGRDRMVVGFTTTMQSVPITTNVVSLNLNQGEVYNII